MESSGQMKDSDYLRDKAAKEKNDLKAMGLLNKALREKRNEKFEDTWLPEFEKYYEVEKRSNGSYTIEDKKYGKIDFFPKANKILIRSKNTWKKPGLKWLINKLIKPRVSRL